MILQQNFNKISYCQNSYKKRWKAMRWRILRSAFIVLTIQKEWGRDILLVQKLESHQTGHSKIQTGLIHGGMGWELHFCLSQAINPFLSDTEYNSFWKNFFYSPTHTLEKHKAIRNQEKVIQQFFCIHWYYLGRWVCSLPRHKM